MILAPDWPAALLVAALVAVALAYFAATRRRPPPATTEPGPRIDEEDQMRVIRFLATYDLRQHGYFHDVSLLRSHAGLTQPFAPLNRQFVRSLLVVCLGVAAHAAGTTCADPLPSVDARFTKLRQVTPVVAEAVLIHFNVEVPKNQVLESWAPYLPTVGERQPLPNSAPTVTIVSDEAPCAVCGRAEAPKRCPRCQTVRYCSIACAKAHRPEHAPECRRMVPL